jgi:hypothetical protein
VSDPILLALIRQLLRQGHLSDMDVQAMAADLERDGQERAAHSVNVVYIEACALEHAADGGNDLA